jgi:hypothetical protein
MSTFIIGPYHRSLEEQLTPEENQAKYGDLNLMTAITVLIVICFWIMNVILELQQVEKNGLEYFKSYWNLIDIFSLILNFLYIG